MLLVSSFYKGNLSFGVNGALDSRTRTTTSTRFDFKFSRVLSKNGHPRILHCTFSFSTGKVSTVIVIEGG